MPHVILNELVVKHLTKDQKREIIQLLESDGVFDDPFDTILPVPEDVKVTGEEKWCRVNWGTEGLFGDSAASPSRRTRGSAITRMTIR